MIFKYNKLTHPQKRDALAVHIHRTFVFEESKRCLQLPEALLEVIDPTQEVWRPSTPILKSLQDISSQCLERTVTRFLVDTLGLEGGEERDSLKALPVFETEKPEWNRKVSRSTKVSP